MKRVSSIPRKNWQEIVENLGLNFHTDESKKPYWHESHYYEFSMSEIDRIEDATNQLHDMCLDLVEDVVENDKFNKLGIDDKSKQLIIRSWNTDQQNLYGRFDFSYGQDGSLKLLEYNADTPTSLFEASVAQWQWLQDTHPKLDQFNSIHEKLLVAWDFMNIPKGETLYFTCLKDNIEDLLTVEYLRDTAHQANRKTEFLYIQDIGLDTTTTPPVFVDNDGEYIEYCFKLYPWEWIMHDEFGAFVRESGIQFIEPAWKMILSNKALLPLLYEMHPDCEFLLPSYFTKDKMRGKYVQKPFLSREGANISIFDSTGELIYKTDGDYGDNYVYQEYHETISFQDGDRKVTPIIGSWVVANESAGIGIREDYGITCNTASFVPHVIV